MGGFTCEIKTLIVSRTVEIRPGEQSHELEEAKSCIDQQL